MTDDKLAFTVREAAFQLAVSRQTVYKLIKSGQIRASVIGGKTVIPLAELHRVLDEAPVAS